MGKVTGFLEIEREQANAPQSRRAHQGLVRNLRAIPRREAARAGRPLHGLRRALLPHRLPGQQPDSRLERPGLQQPLGDGHPPPALDQQLSRVHGPHLPRSLRGRLRAGHQSAAGFHQAHRALHCRARLGRGLDSSRAARAGHRASAWPLSAAARGPGRRAAVAPRRPLRHGLREERPHRRSAPLRDSQLQAREARPRPPHRADEGRRRGLPDQRPRRRERLRSSRSPSSSTPSCFAAAPSIPATFTVPGRELKGIHFAMEFLPQQNRRNEGDSEQRSWHP